MIGGAIKMFELIFVFLFIAFMVVFLMFCKKLLAHFDKIRELKQKELIALVNIREVIGKMDEDFVNLNVDCLFKK